jgi:hypothetical protein
MKKSVFLILVIAIFIGYGCSPKKADQSTKNKVIAHKVVTSYDREIGLKKVSVNGSEEFLIDNTPFSVLTASEEVQLKDRVSNKCWKLSDCWDDYPIQYITFSPDRKKFAIRIHIDSQTEALKIVDLSGKSPKIYDLYGKVSRGDDWIKPEENSNRKIAGQTTWLDKDRCVFEVYYVNDNKIEGWGNETITYKDQYAVGRGIKLLGKNRELCFAIGNDKYRARINRCKNIYSDNNDQVYIKGKMTMAERDLLLSIPSNESVKDKIEQLYKNINAAAKEGNLFF